jgi:CNT family concentrative nucleoside transporter
MLLYDYLIEHNRYLNLVGIGVILGIAWLFSRDRSKIKSRVIINGLLMQFAIAYVTLKTAVGHAVVVAVSEGVHKLYSFAHAGTSFVFGNLSDPSQSWGFIFAVDVLPIIVFFGAFMAILFHFNIIQWCVALLSSLVRPILGTSGAETLCAIANSFLGQTEAPLVIRNYLAGMTSSELLLVMVGGMAHVSGSILVVYAAIGIPVPHLLAASVMAIPGSILIAKILYPETAKPKTATGADIDLEKSSTNLLGAISNGTSDGLQLALNIGAMLISFLALIAMANAILAQVGVAINALLPMIGSVRVLPTLSLNLFFSYIFAPFAYLLGLTGHEALMAGNLLGVKLTMNEMVAFTEMVQQNLQPRTVAIMTYALCGFANFSSIGIQIGGIGALVPSKKESISRLGLLALLGGSLSNLLSAAMAALLL